MALFVPLLLLSGLTYSGIKIYKKLVGEKNTFPISKNAAGEEQSPEEIREQQIQDILSANKHKEIREWEQENTHYLKLSFISIGITSAFALLLPTFTILTVPLLVYCALPVYQDAYNSLVKKGKFKISILDSIAITAGVTTGYYVVSAFGGGIYFIAAKLLDKTRNNNQKIICDIFQELPQYVWLLSNKVEIAISELKAGDIIVVNAGEVIPVDGKIVNGIATIDQHMLTGEAQQCEKEAGDQVMAATIVLTGRIHIQTEKTGTETIAVNITEALNQTSSFEMSLQTEAEETVDKTVLPMIGLGSFTLFTLGAASSLAVFCSNFAEVLRLTAPISMLNFLQLASKNSILIKDGRSLEYLNQIDTVVFDKTGTLTMEQPHLGKIFTSNGYQDNELLTYAAAAEYRQNHPIAKAIVQAATERNLPVPEIDLGHYEIGYGVKVKIADQMIKVGSLRFMEMEGISLPMELKDIEQTSHEQGYSTIYVAINQQIGGILELKPTIRPEVISEIQKLKKRNLSLYIISGDQEYPTQQLAKKLGIENYYANTLPGDKAALIEQLQQEGRNICFVGDGINDSIALKKATVSISLRGASTVATDTAQIILMDQSLAKLDYLFELAGKFRTNQKTGIAVSILPGIICIGGIYLLNFGILSTLIFYNASILAGLGNASIPKLQEKMKSTPPNPKSDLEKIAKQKG